MLRTSVVLLRPRAAALRQFSAAAAARPVGIVGVGQMGNHMATNLMKNGHEVVVCDPDAKQVQALVAKGAQAASTPHEVAERCGSVLTMLPSTAVVENVYFGKDGFHEAIRPDHLFIDSSTIDPIFAKKLSEKVHTEYHSTFVDAPVSGGVMGAENGTLTFMVGGEAEEFERVKPLLQAMGRNIVHCGGSSTGQVAKICNNLALGIQMASVAEAMNLGVALGIEPKILQNIMNTSTAECWASKVNHPYPGLLPNVPASNDYKGGFVCNLIRKDLGIAVDCAKSAEVTLPLTYQVHQLYNMMVISGNGKKDFSYILQFLKGQK